MFLRRPIRDKLPHGNRLPVRIRGGPIKSSRPSNKDPGPRAGKMDAKENSPTPEDSPLTVSNDEIERLLQNAESLVADIADGVGLSDEERSPKELHASPFPEKPDALEALEKTAEQVDRVEEQTGSMASLGEQDVDTISDSPESETGVEPEEPDVADDQRSPAAPAKGKFADGQPAIEAGPCPPSPPESAPKTTESTEAPAKSALASRQTNLTEASSAKPDETSSTSDSPPSGRLRRLKVALGVARSVALFPLKATIATLILIDKPFKRLRPTTKLVLGLMGLVSLLMGLAAIFLPKLLASNPYESIPPYSS